MKTDPKALIERLEKHVFYGDARLFNMKKHSPLAMEAAQALRNLTAENERLKSLGDRLAYAIANGTSGRAALAAWETR